MTPKNTQESDGAIPKGLAGWFVVHFVVDMLFAVPLIVAPRALLGALGWTEVDPVAARLVGAALMGIGVQSWLGRREGPEAFAAMLNLKIIWSLSACLGLSWSLTQGAPAATWLVLGIFAPFSLLWIHYRRKLGRSIGGVRSKVHEKGHGQP
jgi:hypothetical protein